MIVTPVACAVIGAILPFTPLASVLGFTALPLSFFLILIGMIATYFVLVEIAKRRFYAVHTHPRRPALTTSNATNGASPAERHAHKSPRDHTAARFDYRQPSTTGRTGAVRPP